MNAIKTSDNYDLSRQYAQDIENQERNYSFIANMNDMMKMIADSMGNSNNGIHNEIESLTIRNSQSGMFVTVKRKQSVFVPKR